MSLLPEHLLEDERRWMAHRTTLSDSYSYIICMMAERISDLRGELEAAERRNGELARANWENVCASEVFQELKHGEYRAILDRLSDQQISAGKAAELIAERAALLSQKKEVKA